MTTDDTAPVFLVERQPWMVDAACRQMPTSLFFKGRYESHAEIKAICAECPVREQCLEYGIDEPYGMWGGMSAKQRRKLRVQRRRESGEVSAPKRYPARVALCGTQSGYSRHLRQQTPMCDECREAHSEYERRRRALRLVVG